MPSFSGTFSPLVQLDLWHRREVFTGDIGTYFSEIKRSGGEEDGVGRKGYCPLLYISSQS